ncbi:MAG: AraC family transcriptional regulator ligand-binding domain-containing protein [Pseudomonadota bacterium]
MSRHGTLTTTAAGMGSLPERLEACAGPAAVQICFARAQLPLGIIEDRSARIPIHSMTRLFSEAERFTGNPTFGLEIGLSMSGNEIGHWFDFSSQAETLRAGLQRLIETIKLFQNGPRGSLVDVSDGAMFSYFVPRDKTLSYAAHSDHHVPLILSFIQRYLGQSWRPPWIEMDYPDRGHGRAFSDLVGARPIYGRSAVSVPLSKAELNARRPHDADAKEVLCSKDVKARIFHRQNDFLVAVETHMALEMFETAPELSTVAGRMNMSTRSLQRKLMLEGYSFREILSRLRYRTAQDLMQDTQLSITQIAHRLGYTDTANFSRAFKSWSGYQPSEHPRHSHR